MTTQAILAAPPAPPALDTLEIVVSLKDIVVGVQSDRKECAVVQALKRAGHEQVDVTNGHVSVDGRKYQPTDELRTWLNRFDRDRRAVYPDRWVLQMATS